MYAKRRAIWVSQFKDWRLMVTIRMSWCRCKVCNTDDDVPDWPPARLDSDSLTDDNWFSSESSSVVISESRDLSDFGSSSVSEVDPLASNGCRSALTVRSDLGLAFEACPRLVPNLLNETSLMSIWFSKVLAWKMLVEDVSKACISQHKWAGLHTVTLSPNEP